MPKLRCRCQRQVLLELRRRPRRRQVRGVFGAARVGRSVLSSLRRADGRSVAPRCRTRIPGSRVARTRRGGASARGFRDRTASRGRFDERISSRAGGSTFQRRSAIFGKRDRCGSCARYLADVAAGAGDPAVRPSNALRRGGKARQRADVRTNGDSGVRDGRRSRRAQSL